MFINTIYLHGEVDLFRDQTLTTTQLPTVSPVQKGQLLLCYSHSHHTYITGGRGRGGGPALNPGKSNEHFILTDLLSNPIKPRGPHRTVVTADYRTIYFTPNIISF